MKTLSIDIETYSDQNLAKTGVYRYVESPAFEILLFSYSVDSGPVQIVDLACGEEIPTEVISALSNGHSTLPLNASACPATWGIPPGITLTRNPGAVP